MTSPLLSNDSAIHKTSPFHPTRIRALMLDWAGTVVDYGSRAPVEAFRGALSRHRIDVTVEQTRVPMGKAKRDHIASILAMPEVAQQWRQKYDRDHNESDIENIYRDFQTIQFDCLLPCSHVIPGAAAAVDRCRAAGLKIGSSTGYTRAMMDQVMAQAKAEGYVPDIMLCSEDTAAGRPAPWLIFEGMRRMNVYPPMAVVTVDDTVAGIGAGRNAGTWCVGIALTGNEIGLSEREVAHLAPDKLRRMMTHARQRLYEAGAHIVIDSLAELPESIENLERRLTTGDRP